MTCYEKIMEIVKRPDLDLDNNTPEKLITLAYYIGRESATKEVSDNYMRRFEEQRERASHVRYKNVVNNVIGDTSPIYFGDYAQDMTKIFGSDEWKGE